MRFRFLVKSVLLVGFIVTTVVALRAADEKPKGKEGDAAPPAGTVKFTTAPAAVQKTYKEETKNSKIELLGKGKNEEDGKVFYLAIVGIGENNYRIAVAEDGQLLEKVMEPFKIEIKIEDCPAPVQKSFRDEVKGAKVEAVTKVSAGKRSDFIINVTIQKDKYQVIFSEDGTLMSKVIDDGSDDEADVAKPAEKTETKKGK